MFDGALENPLSAILFLALLVLSLPATLVCLRDKASLYDRPGLRLAGMETLLICWAFLAPLAVFNHLRPDSLIWLFGPQVGDGGLVEYATVAAWFASIVFAMRLAATAGGPLSRLTHVAVGLGAFVLMGEEVSWGQWILSWESPTYFAENNLQGETNAHNFFSPAVFDAAYAVVGILLAAGVGAVRFTRIRLWPIGALRAWPVTQWICRSRFGVPLVLSAAVFMQHHMFQELAELGLSMAVLYALWWTTRRHPYRLQPTHLSSTVSA